MQIDPLSTRCQKCEAPTAREEMRAGSLLPGIETSRQVVLKRARFVEGVIASGQGRCSMRFQPSQRSFELTPNALNQLKLVVQAHRTPQAVARRAQLILLSHTHPDWSTKQVARRLNRHESWVRKWRRRWDETHSLKDAPRSGAPRRFSPEVRAQVTALACSLPRSHGQHHWPLARRRADPSLALS